MREKLLLDIYILEILEKYSSSKNRLNQKDIIYYLEKDYNIKVSRNTLSGYIGDLKARKYVVGERGLYLNRLFSNVETKILIESIISSKSIPESEMKTLLEKIRKMAEPESRKRYVNIFFAEELNRTDNLNVCAVLDRLEQAIEMGKKVEITSCNYNVNGILEENRTKIVSPYYIVAEKGRYYLLCYSGREDVEPRRIDRICNVKILGENRFEINQMPKYMKTPFSLSSFMQEHIYMYSGETERIKLCIRTANIGDLIDWFGKDFRIIKQENEKVVISLRANVNVVYFWGLQYGEVVEILEPERLRKKVYEGALKIARKHQ